MTNENILLKVEIKWEYYKKKEYKMTKGKKDDCQRIEGGEIRVMTRNKESPQKVKEREK